MPQMLSTGFLTELRNNNRLRLGIWLIIVILIGYLFLFLNERQVKLKQDYNNAVDHLTQLQSLTNQTQWIERAHQVQELRTQLEARLWQANTKGLAQATFQQWFSAEISKAKIPNIRLKVEATVEMPQFPYYWKVTAKLEGDFVAQNFNQLLLALAQSQRMVVTEHLHIRPTVRQYPWFTLIVSSYFESGDRSQETGVRRQETGVRKSGVRSQETGDRRQESGVRRQETGDRSQETGDRST